MQRTVQHSTARFLLLFALVGTIAPIALASTATPPHACCLRKTHQCHAAAAESGQREFRDTSCCPHDGARAITTSQWALPQPAQKAAATRVIVGREISSHAVTPATQLLASLSTRAPPAC